MAIQRVLRTPDAAEYLGVSESWLEKLRLRREGPRFVRLGHRAVGYDIRDLDRWLDRHREKTTSRATTASTPLDAA